MPRVIDLGTSAVARVSVRPARFPYDGRSATRANGTPRHVVLESATATRSPVGSRCAMARRRRARGTATRHHPGPRDSTTRRAGSRAGSTTAPSARTWYRARRRASRSRGPVRSERILVKDEARARKPGLGRYHERRQRAILLVIISVRLDISSGYLVGRPRTPPRLTTPAAAGSPIPRFARAVRTDGRSTPGTRRTRTG